MKQASVAVFGKPFDGIHGITEEFGGAVSVAFPEALDPSAWGEEVN